MTCQHFIEAIGLPEASFGGRTEKVKKCRYDFPWHDPKKCDQFPYRGREDSACWNQTRAEWDEFVQAAPGRW
jgi:hypothetical protein